MRLFSLPRVLANLPTTASGCKIWPKLGTDGYPTNQLHHKILEKKLGRPIRKGCMCLHTCDTPSCVEEEHLWEGTHQDNMNDMKSKGRSAKGSRCFQTGRPRRGSSHPGTKLTEQDVLSMRQLYSTGRYTYDEMAERFGVTRSNASQIIRKITWSHI